MTQFELFYSLLRPACLPLYSLVYRKLRETLPDSGACCLLDVGGRKSHYTIGIPASITITDIERITPLQESLHLGVNDLIQQQTRRRRSNVCQYQIDDMTESNLKDKSFDGVVSVEVLEHVEKDAAFIREIARVLKPGGWFLMTTPNGDSVKNTNPDHKRHYTKRQLEERLAESFDSVVVDYAILGGKSRTLGLKPWSPRRPFRTIASMVSNLVNLYFSTRPGVKDQASGTRHLIAFAKLTSSAPIHVEERANLTTDSPQT